MVDLHTHTRCSDGALAPAELVALAARKGLSAVAITDHDTVEGNAEAVAAGKNASIAVVPGVEISTQWTGVTFHLLGLGLDRTTPLVEERFRFLADSRRERTPRMLQKLRELGIEVDPKEVAREAGGGVVGRPHLARVLVRMGAASSVQDAFDRFLGRGKAAYVDKARLSPTDACAVIRDAGGAVVLAHPGLVEQDRPGLLPALLDHLLPLGLDGLEAYYSRHSPTQSRRYRQLARERGLIVTGGSDFHDGRDGGPDLGSGLGDLRVPDDCYRALTALLAGRNG